MNEDTTILRASIPAVIQSSIFLLNKVVFPVPAPDKTSCLSIEETRIASVLEFRSCSFSGIEHEQRRCSSSRVNRIIYFLVLTKFHYFFISLFIIIIKL